MEEQKILLWGDLFLQKTEKAQESFSRCKDLLFSLQEQNAELEGAWQGQAEAVFCRKTDEETYKIAPMEIAANRQVQRVMPFIRFRFIFTCFPVPQRALFASAASGRGIDRNTFSSFHYKFFDFS